MYYSLFCYDHKDSVEKRKNIRDEHIQYLNKFKKSILFAGPIMDEDELIIGSLIVMDFNTKEEIEVFSKNDPYFLGGLFKSVSIHRFKRVF